MSKGSDSLMSALLGDRWTITSAPGAATTVAASVSGATNERITLECLSYTIKNTNASAFTVVTSVRDASVAGTVIASWEDVIAAGAVGSKHLPGLGISTSRAMHITQDTVLASVSARVSATGWKLRT